MFCVDCRKEISTTSHARCPERGKNIVRYCNVCGTEIHKKPNGLFPLRNSCVSCHAKKDRRISIKDASRGITLQFTELVKVIYECPCKVNGKSKNMHHYDYSLPLSVILLCDLCHGKEHARLNTLSGTSPADRDGSKG
jgi:hypothetical protein